MELVVLLIVAVAIGASGIRFVTIGHKAILVRLGKRTDSVYDEGLAWIVPVVDRLQEIKCDLRATRIEGHSVQTGIGISVDVSIICSWEIDPDQLFRFASTSNPGFLLDSHIKDVVSKFFRFVSVSQDIYEGTLLIKLSDILGESVKLRVRGIQHRLEGRTWSELAVSQLPDRVAALGISIQDINVISVTSSAIVKDAHERNKAGEIDANTLDITTPAIANAIQQSVRAGGAADIAQLQTERAMLPHGKRTEPPVYNQVLMPSQNQQPTSFTATSTPLQVSHISKRAPDDSDPEGTPEGERDRPE